MSRLGRSLIDQRLLDSSPSSIMAANASHHYVPQFYFKLFNGGERLISVLLTKDGRIIPRASIKGQCTRHKF